MSDIYLVSLPLSASLIVDGKDAGKLVLNRPLIISYKGELIKFPKGLVTDFTSWPSWIPSPKWMKMAVAGVVHDFLFRYAELGCEGRKIGYFEANKIWREVANAGLNRSVRLNAVQAWLGWTGLSIGGWVKWMDYRRKNLTSKDICIDGSPFHV